MRRLSDEFLLEMKEGFLSGLTEAVRQDKDLDLQIRENYLNVYFKGNSLLKLEQPNPGRYRIKIHPKFTSNISLVDLVDEATTNELVGQIPRIKANIIRYGKSSLEIEYEQMIIRANNYEPRNNSEYFIVDRQYVAGQAGRFDLTGFYWPRSRRRKGQVVSPCLMEIKFALNQDIQHVHEQLDRYYLAMRDLSARIAEEIETIFYQKLELGLFKQSADRLAAMKTLKFAPDIDRFQFILILVDYNPNSKLFDEDKLSKLPFASQVRIFHSGFAMWEARMVEAASAN